MATTKNPTDMTTRTRCLACGRQLGDWHLGEISNELCEPCADATARDTDHGPQPNGHLDYGCRWEDSDPWSTRCETHTETMHLSEPTRQARARAKNAHMDAREAYAARPHHPADCMSDCTGWLSDGSCCARAAAARTGAAARTAQRDDSRRRGRLMTGDLEAEMATISARVVDGRATSADARRLREIAWSIDETNAPRTVEEWLGEHPAPAGECDDRRT